MGGFRAWRVVAVSILLCIVPSVARGDAANDPAPAIELVGAFVAGAPITGAVLHEEHLFITTANTLSIYDVTDPADPVIQSSVPNPHAIHGELLPTNGEILLLNEFIGGGELSIWDVEDKSNPVRVATVFVGGDEHFGCVLDCRWAYGSDGTILDLHDPTRPGRMDRNWKEAVGLGDDFLHRIDEFRDGFMVTAPIEGSPVVVDVRRPLRPKIVGRTGYPEFSRSVFLYSDWPTQGRSRYLLSSLEFTSSRRCRNRDEGALLAFDTKGWPAKKRFPLVGRYQIARAERRGDEDCSGYYFSPRPGFGPEGGIVLLPHSLEGVRMVSVRDDGSVKEVAAFIPPVSDVWLSFWIDDEIFYALNRTGEVYILRYVPDGSGPLDP